MEASNNIEAANALDFPFFETVQRLREHEELVLFSKLQPVTPEEREALISFLRSEYDSECLSFPLNAPSFEGSAAVWAAETLYVAAQLLLDRSQEVEELEIYFPGYKGVIDASAMLSADLCLRFLPPVYLQAREMDPEDPLLACLERVFREWDFSGLSLYADLDLPYRDSDLGNEGFRLHYADRVIQYRAAPALKIPMLKATVQAALGNHSEKLWPGFSEALKSIESQNNNKQKL